MSIYDRVFQSVNPGESSIAMHLHLTGKGTGLEGRFGTWLASPPKATLSVSVLCICISM